MPISLVIQLARFGDLLQTKRLLRSLVVGGDEVHLVVDHSMLPLARLVYPEVMGHSIAAHRSGRNPAGGTSVGGTADVAMLTDMIGSCAELKAICPQRVYNLNFSGLNFALSSLFSPEIVRGYSMKNGQQLKDAWADRGFRLSKNRKISPLNLVDFWAGYADSPILPRDVNPPAAGQGEGIGIVLAGRQERRSLPMKTLALLASAAFERVGHGPIYLFGTKAEARRARELQKHLRPSLLREVKDCTGKTDWQGLADHLSGLDLLLTPDTGTMHLAAHLGTPVLAFFLASAWCHETGPYGEGHRVVQAALPCSPCAERDICPHDVRCAQSFASRSLLRYVSGRSARDWPEEMVLFQTGFDEVGLRFDPLAGTDVFAEERVAMRGMVGEYQGLSPFSKNPPTPVMLRDFYRERDWIPVASLSIG